MAAEFDGTRKRGAAALLDDPFEAKRGRCSPSAAAAMVTDLGINMEFDPVEALQSVFPGADPQVMNTPANSTEWAELIVKEMPSASDLNDARNRVFRILEMLDKCAANCSTPDEAHKMREVTNASAVASYPPFKNITYHNRLSSDIDSAIVRKSQHEAQS